MPQGTGYIIVKGEGWLVEDPYFGLPSLPRIIACFLDQGTTFYSALDKPNRTIPWRTYVRFHGPSS